MFARITELTEELDRVKQVDFPRKAEAVANNWRAKVAAQAELIEKLHGALNLFDPSESVGAAYKWIGPDPEFIDEVLCAYRLRKDEL